jgi:thiamine biosynthesis lipoprotein ApbE
MKNILSLSLAVILITAFTPKKNEWYIARYENILGTSMELKVAAASPETSKTAEQVVLREIDRLSKILSGYDPQSEFSKWFKTTNIAVPVSNELYEVLDLFDHWRLRTNGALDPSAEAVTRVWKKAAQQQRLPDPAELSAAVEKVRQSHWRLDPATHSAIHLDQVPLVLNSFAKSYIISHAVAEARKATGAPTIVLNIGGDIVVSGETREPVAISDPKADAENDRPIDKIKVGNAAIATSGNYRRGELIAGQWYSHIVDPRTGQPADGVLSATVVAPSATDAGALATAFNVLTVAECTSLAGQYKGVEYLILTKDGHRIQSTGWKGLEIIPDPATPPAVDARRKEKASEYELLVNLEINLQKEGSVKRPYVAIWVEDQDHAPVRTITLWHGSERYLPELRSWYLKYRGLYTSDPKFGASVTSATRSAGKYSVKWDGKDDKGNDVKPGKYVIKIEVSREHGTYQLMRQELDWNDQPKSFTLPGNVEISSASLDYRKKANG